MYNRYSDISKFITDIDMLQIDEESCVYISEYYDIAVDLEGCFDNFEKQKSFIVYLAKQVGELDNIV